MGKRFSRNRAKYCCQRQIDAGLGKRSPYYLLFNNQFGTFKFLLPELSQIIFSPGPLIFKLRKGLKNYRQKDFLLLTGDPAIIGVACSIVSDMTNGKYKLLKWDKQERKYYAIEINLHEKGNIDE